MTLPSVCILLEIVFSKQSHIFLNILLYYFLGATLSISTMAAAALGNTLSDVFGVGSAWYVEHWAAKLGISPPALSIEQLDLKSSR